MDLSFSTSFSKFNEFIRWNKQNPNQQTETSQTRNYLLEIKEKISHLWQQAYSSKSSAAIINSKENPPNATEKSNRLRMKIVLGVIGTLAFSIISAAYLNQAVKINPEDGKKILTNLDPKNFIETQEQLDKLTQNNFIQDRSINKEKEAVKTIRERWSVTRYEDLSEEGSTSRSFEWLTAPIGMTAFGVLLGVGYCFNQSKKSLNTSFLRLPGIDTTLEQRIEEIEDNSNLGAGIFERKDENLAEDVEPKINIEEPKEKLPEPKKLATSSEKKSKKTVDDKLKKALDDANQPELLSKYRLQELRKRNEKELLDKWLGEAIQKNPNMTEDTLECFCASYNLIIIDDKIKKREKRCADLENKEEIIKLVQSEYLSDEQTACTATMKGNTRKTMEDTHVMSILPFGVGLYGIFDGHGGSECSEFLSKNVEQSLKEGLPPILKIVDEKQRNGKLREYLKSFFVELNRGFRKSIGKESSTENDNAASTAIIVLFIDGKLWTANVGDTRGVVSYSKNNKAQVIALSEDADLSKEKFKKYIQKKGGKICENEDLRVEVGAKTINMARAVGYSENSPVTARAKVTCYDLNKIPEGNRFLIIGCDGLWDALSSNEASEMLQEKLKETTDCKELAIYLRDQAYIEGSTDNISVLVCDFSKIREEDAPKKEKSQRDLMIR